MKKITDDLHFREVCKPGKMHLTCRYIVAGPDGIACVKHDDEFNRQIDERVAQGRFTAQGDNCEGLK